MVFYPISAGEISSIIDTLDGVLEDYIDEQEIRALRTMLEEIKAGKPIKESTYE